MSLQLVSQKQSKPTLLNKTKSYNHRFNCLLTWNIICLVGHCLQNSTKKLHNKSVFTTTPPPGIQPGYPKGIPYDSPVSVQQHDIKLDTKAPQSGKETELWKIVISPCTKSQQIQTVAQSIVFRTTPPPWNLALCLCNNIRTYIHTLLLPPQRGFSGTMKHDMTLSLQGKPPEKKIAVSTGATGRPVAPLVHIFWNFHWLLSFPEIYLEPMVKSWGWLVLKRDIYIFTLKASRLETN